MTGTLDFNPHEAPPQELKDVFKSWKGPLTPERERILDMNAVNMPRLDSIPHHRLVDVFSRFSRHGENIKQDIAEREQFVIEESGAVYSSRDVPGR